MTNYKALSCKQNKLSEKLFLSHRQSNCTWNQSNIAKHVVMFFIP